MITDYYVVTDIQYTVSFEIENIKSLSQTPLAFEKARQNLYGKLRFSNYKLNTNRNYF